MSEIFPPGTFWFAGSSTLAQAYDVCEVPEDHLYFATGGANTLLKSSDGLTFGNWYSGAPSLTFAARRCIAWSPDLGILVSLGEDSQALWSDDPTDTGSGAPHWGVSTIAGATTEVWCKVIWVPELALFVATSSSGSINIITSPDGKNWTARLTGADASLTALAWSPDLGRLAAVGNHPRTATYQSSDALSWGQAIVKDYPSQDLWADMALSPDLALYCVVGSVGAAPPNYSSGFAISNDGITWQQVNLGNTFNVISVCWAAQHKKFYALSGGNGGGFVLFFSSEGINWATRPYGLNDVGSTGHIMQSGRLIYSPERENFVAVGTGSSFYPIASPKIVGVGAPVYLFEIEAYDRSAHALTTFRFTTAGYNDPSAPGYYEPRVTQSPDLGRFLLAPGTTTGANKATGGEITLGNDDGALDTLRDYGLAGQKVTIFIGYQNLGYKSFAKLAVGKIQQALFELSVGGVGSASDIVILQLRDRSTDFGLPLQASKYAGTNVLPDGLEGVDDIKGKPKPLVWGAVLNVTPAFVNTSRLIYQVNNGEVNDIPAVYDAGAVLTRGSDYSSQSDMETNAPSAGDYRAWPGGGYFRLGSNPTGVLTADVTQGNSATDRSAAQIANLIATGPGGLVSADIAAADIVALDALNGAEVGIYIDSETTIQAALDAVLGSIGANGGFDRFDILRMRRLNFPVNEGAPVTLRAPDDEHLMDADDLPIQAIRFLPTNDPDKGLPTYLVTLNYQKNYTVEQGNGLSGTALADPTRVAFLANETRTVMAKAPWVQTANPLAVQKTVETLLVDATDAQDECSRQLSLYAGRRDFVEIDTPLTVQAISLLDIGDTIVVALSRYGYDEGLPMIVTGMDYNTSSDILTLQCWGGVMSILDDLSNGIEVDLGNFADAQTDWADLGTWSSPGIDRRIDLGTWS